MKQRFRKLIVMFMTFILITQLPGFDAIVALAADVYVTQEADVTISTDTTDNYVFSSGGEKSLTVEEGVSLNGSVDMIAQNDGTRNLLNNYGNITGMISVGISNTDIFNTGTISNIYVEAGSLSLTNTGNISSLTMAEGESAVTVSGGSISQINVEHGDLIISDVSDIENFDIAATVGTVTLNGCNINSLNSELPVNLTENMSNINSATVESFQGEGSVFVSDDLTITATSTATIMVSFLTNISSTSGVTVTCYGKSFTLEPGYDDTLLNSHGLEVDFLNDDTLIASDDNVVSSKYWYGATLAEQVYTAIDGYYFPEDYSSTVTSDGKGILDVQRVDETTISVIYTLSNDETGDVNITLPPATKNISEGTGSLNVGDLYYGGAVSPELSSTTNETDGIVIQYKVAGTDDSTYTNVKPSAIGSYTARAILPANDRYYEVILTDDFNISYLPVPEYSYSVNGTTGENDYYTSAVTIIPPKGYLVAEVLDGKYTSSLVINSSRGAGYLYYMNSATGEKTAGIWSDEFLIDAVAPSIDAIAGKTYYAEYVEVAIKDENLSKITINGEELKDFSEGTTTLKLHSEGGMKKYEIAVTDLAGNAETINIVVAADWVKSGVLPSGELVNLISGYQYKLGSGKWTVEGDATSYNGNITFYVQKEGEYIFSKQ